MDEADADARALASRVAQQIGDQYSGVKIDRSSEDSGLAIVRFFPPEEGQVQVAFTSYFDTTFQIEAASYVEEFDSPGLIEVQVELALKSIHEIVDRGLIEVRTLWWLGPLSPSKVGAPDSLWIQEALARPFSRVHRRWSRWWQSA